MLDLGWSELLLIGVVALIVVGPKDLPIMFRTLGRLTARLRGMAREFTRALEEAADESGARDLSRDLRNLTSPRAMGLDALKKATELDFDPLGEDNEIADEDSARPPRAAAGTPAGTGAATAAGPVTATAGGPAGPAAAAEAPARPAGGGGAPDPVAPAAVELSPAPAPTAPTEKP